MKVLFASSELAPLAKVGGLADVAGSLPSAIKKLGVDIRAVIPRYEAIDEKKHHLKLLTKNIIVEIGQTREKVDLYETKLNNLTVYLIENKEYLSRGGIYFEKSAFVEGFKEIQRFLFFSQAVVEIFSNFSWTPEIIHCQDWHTAIVPLLIKSKMKNKKPKTLLTIHNLANQGKWKAAEIFNFLGLKGDELESLRERFGPDSVDLNLMQQGIFNADLLNTVSPSYAREILTTEFGEDLEKDCQRRKNDLFGILNGIDQEIFSPEKDKFIKVNYSLETLKRKIENKKDLQRFSNLSIGNYPLFGFISRLTNQKGSELIVQIASKLIKERCQFVFLGQGQDCYEQQLLILAKKYPKSVYVKIGFEPCGLGQMIAMRYGAVPIVRAVGGLKDSVKKIKILKDKVFGTGFVFKNYQPTDLLKAIEHALVLFKNKENWREIQKNGMTTDFSWQKSAKKYLKLYHKLTY